MILKQIMIYLKLRIKAKNSPIVKKYKNFWDIYQDQIIIILQVNIITKVTFYKYLLPRFVLLILNIN